MNMKRIICTLVTIITMALAGCGGGGGGSSPMSNNNMNDMQTPPGNTGGDDSMPTTIASLTSTTATNAQRAAAKVADARPSFGSITQSSNTIGNVTLDRVAVTTTYGATQNIYEIKNGQNGSTWSISSADGNPRRIETTADDTGGFKGSELNKQVNGGRLWVDVYSDIEQQGDTDYLSGGIWLFVPNNPDDAESYVGGAFGDGNDPFTQSALPAVIGTADYIGEATGIYSATDSATENDATEIGYFDADAILTADFGNGSGLGTISGKLTNFEVDGESLQGSLILEQASIGSSDSGFFEGDLGGSSQGTRYTGKWGGAFFGNEGTDNKPGSVGGTFGGRSTDSSQSFVGAFGAYKQ